MSEVNASRASTRLTKTQWLICTMAAIGFAFDIYELLMMPYVVPHAVLELTGAKPGEPAFRKWASLLFYGPAFFGGIFGLLGGYLTDRLGRRRVLTWSILLYAFSAFAAGFSTSIEMLVILRCFTFVGVCVEFVAAVAWLAELFSDPHQRENVLGYTQAFSSIGGLLVTVVNALLVTHGSHLPAIAIPAFLTGILNSIAPDHQHEAWRYTLMSGVLPALPLIFIRPFLPESPVWAQKRASGTLKRPRFSELFAPDLRRTTIVTALMFACSYGAAFGAIQQVPQIVPGLPEVKQATKDLAPPAKAKYVQKTAASLGTSQEIGGLIGRFLLAMLATVIVSRRALLRVFQIPGLIVVPLVFAIAAVHSITWLYYGIFFAGLFTVAQFSFWGNYLPRAYPLHLRGTGESFAANIGGRLVGTSFFWVTQSLQTVMPGANAPTQLAYASAAVALFVYVVGSLACFFLPEPSLGLADD